VIRMLYRTIPGSGMARIKHACGHIALWPVDAEDNTPLWLAPCPSCMVWPPKEHTWPHSPRKSRARACQPAV
jgi:hypothetical protein